jgi:hypothetical protein
MTVERAAVADRIDSKLFAERRRLSIADKPANDDDDNLVVDDDDDDDGNAWPDIGKLTTALPATPLASFLRDVAIE